MPREPWPLEGIVKLLMVVPLTVALAALAAALEQSA